MTLQPLIEGQLQLTDKHQTQFKRQLFSQINWDDRLIALLGARGVGKTTLLLQHYQQEFTTPGQCLYILGDDIAVVDRGLRQIAEEFSLQGGQKLIIDEIHKYPNWSQELKNIYDLYPDLSLIISGSSNINIVEQKYDLSRRVATYHLPGLSLREFINLEYNLNLPSLDLEDILHKPTQVSQKVVHQLQKQDLHIIPIMQQYWQYGYYPYYRHGIDSYYSRLKNVVDKVLHEDVTSVHKIKQPSIAVLKKILTLVASSHPFQADITNMARNLQTSRKTIYNFIQYLVEAELLLAAQAEASGNKLVRKPQKLLINNPNLYHMLEKTAGYETKIGSIRESFALNQLDQMHQVTIPEQGDFMVNHCYTFEVGGKNKNLSQIAQVEQAYVMSDNLEYGYNRKIPLYLLGFLY
jgi:hypothetical protein